MPQFRYVRTDLKEREERAKKDEFLAALHDMTDWTYKCYRGKRLLGTLRRQKIGKARWHAQHRSGLSCWFSTRQDAAEYLYDLHRNVTSAKRLRSIAQANLEPIVGMETDDGGFYDVLCSFAVSVGYEVWTRPWKREPSTVQGRLSYRTRRIWVDQNQTPIMRAFTLAHELAHIYTRIACRASKAMNEQVTEAVAAMLMDEYDLDVRQSAAAYIRSHYCHTKMQRRRLFIGALDTLTIACYTAFSRDLRDFLRRGGDDACGQNAFGQSRGSSSRP